jgi:DNA topoisomerase VI subunit B
MPQTYTRTTFQTSRLLEFLSEKKSQMQIGVTPGAWGLALIKELIDNALDAWETAHIAPEIRITLTPDGLTVADHGPGLPPALIERSLDYAIRVSDKTSEDLQDGTCDHTSYACQKRRYTSAVRCS